MTIVMVAFVIFLQNNVNLVELSGVGVTSPNAVFNGVG